MPREGEVKVDCAKIRELVIERCGLTAAKAEKRMNITHAVWHRMLGGAQGKRHSHIIVTRDNAMEVIRLACEILNIDAGELSLEAILSESPETNKNGKQEDKENLREFDEELARNYLVNSWKSTSEELSSKISCAQNWINSVGRHINISGDSVPNTGLYDAHLSPRIRLAVAYDVTLADLVERYDRLTRKLETLVAEHNDLNYPRTDSFHIFYRSMGIMKILDPTHDDTKEKDMARSAHQHLKNLYSKYNVPERAIMKELFENPKYIADLESSVSTVRECASELQNLLHALSARIEYYDVALRNA